MKKIIAFLGSLLIVSGLKAQTKPAKRETTPPVITATSGKGKILGPRADNFTKAPATVAKTANFTKAPAPKGITQTSPAVQKNVVPSAKRH